MAKKIKHSDVKNKNPAHEAALTARRSSRGRLLTVALLVSDLLRARACPILRPCGYTVVTRVKVTGGVACYQGFHVSA